jgi:hypothetical protein
MEGPMARMRMPRWFVGIVAGAMVVAGGPSASGEPAPRGPRLEQSGLSTTAAHEAEDILRALEPKALEAGAGLLAAEP